jgi:hypothetical protein
MNVVGLPLSRRQAGIDARLGHFINAARIVILRVEAERIEHLTS